MKWVKPRNGTISIILDLHIVLSIGDYIERQRERKREGERERQRDRKRERTQRNGPISII